ncbi:hypothetical protein [Streptomyces spectabilis]|uniref:Uncharacterized protein n=1 Tax=Streptomyces spectabilis TaxID=68270 RepID=A0A5P2X7I7_STRST|nr:hypothetical protein [Streptomyces spectabilis]MBB5108254.1 hypothetical protein [Streptomyces spectabilis]MCI3901015.1 hypothetical protein [Streptomyces spectabilis]QEV58516.1 hypothetical protein CP982_07180 [Streptomyces spectabilis]GGV45488.1 hypothetical protein GCM10010245_71150 [Streptomyces spectabilis]
MADFNIPDDLIELERSAWEQIQAGTLTVETAQAVQQRITEVAAETGQPRNDVEIQVKRIVRNPELEDGTT